MTDLTVFSSDKFGDIRTAEIDGEHWFVAVDVCKALDINNARQAVSRLADDERSHTVITTDGIRGSSRQVTVNIVNESGLYVLILQSRKPEAVAFQRWITHEVLPEIRKNGGYTRERSAETLPAQADDADRVPQPVLTPADHIRAASIIAGCRNGYLPMVLAELKAAGLDVSRYERMKPVAPRVADDEEDYYGYDEWGRNWRSIFVDFMRRYTFNEVTFRMFLQGRIPDSRFHAIWLGAMPDDEEAEIMCDTMNQLIYRFPAARKKR